MVNEVISKALSFFRDFAWKSMTNERMATDRLSAIRKFAALLAPDYRQKLSMLKSRTLS